MSSFTSRLIVSPLPYVNKHGGNIITRIMRLFITSRFRWQLIREFEYDVGTKGSGRSIYVPIDFVTDFASVPEVTTITPALVGIILVILGHILRMDILLTIGILILAITSLLAWLHPWGTWGKAAVLHDFLYQMLNSPDGAYLYESFPEAKLNPRKFADDIFLESMYVMHTTKWQAETMYWCVRTVGWLSWHQNCKHIGE